jgi:hypothetical protein
MNRWKIIKAFSLVAFIWLSFMVTMAVLFTSMITKCHAADLLLGGYSYHFEKPDPEFGEPEKFNESNELIGIKFDWLAITAMKNSYYENSYSVLVFYDEFVNQNIDLLFVAGAASGYQDSNLNHVNGVAGVVYLGADFHPSSDDWGIVFSVAPGSFVSINLRMEL